MAPNDEFDALARTLCYSPHKAVLLKNALQCQQTLPKSTSGARPRISVMDITLFSASGLLSRVEDLQPVNDPFIVDNIFKSPKKRRRGLLSWSAMPVAEVNALTERQGFVVPLWDFPRHMRARNRRRSILGSKCSLSSMRRRRLRPSGACEHSRSASDPTTAIIAVSPAAMAIARGSESSSSGKLDTPSCDTTDGSLGYLSPRSIPSSTATITIKPPRKCRRLRSFPKLTEKDTPPPALCRSSGAFINYSPAPARECATLRGAPGHPATSTLPSRAPPYISVSALRLVSDPGCGIREPAPALLRPETLRTLRCTSMPCGVPLKAGKVPCSAYMTRPLKDCASELRIPPPAAPFGRPAPTTKFAGVKNSLDIRHPAPCSQSRPQKDKCVSPGTASSEQWLLPAVFTLLRRLTACGGGRRR